MAKPEEEMTTQMPQGEGAATAAEAAPPQPSRKDKYMEGFRKNHPDWQEGDEEGFYGALSDEADAWGKEREGYQGREKEVHDALSGSVLNAALFNRAMDKEPLPLALLELYPEEFQQYMNDPSNTDAIKKVMEKHAKDIEENQKLDEEAKANLDATNALIDEMIGSGEIADDDEANELLKMLSEISLGLMVNKVEKDWLLAAKKAINHDADVEAARTEGEIAGRNQKITAQRKDSQRGGNTHSGLGSGNAGQRLTRKETAEATGSNRRSMWDGMKTNKLN